MGYLKKKNPPQKLVFEVEKTAEFRLRLENYCAYQERCEKEVKDKLKEWKVPSDIGEEFLQYLKENKFIHQERFSNAFAGGKFRVKKWGKQKIAAHLYHKQVEGEMVESALAQIQDETYRDTLLLLLEKKASMLKETDVLKRKKKLFDYARSKGYESSLVMELMQQNNELVHIER